MGIIGKKEFIEETFIESLKVFTIESNISVDKYELLIVFKEIPIKIRIYIAEKLENLIYNFEKIQKLDVILITLNLYEPASLKAITKGLLKEFNEIFSFQGLSILVGMDNETLFNRSRSKNFKISRYQLEKITKDLKLIYCFEIINKNSDVNEIYNTILDDFKIRFQYSTPELFEAARDYGKKLVS